jgi:uncharacterized protein
MLTDPLNKPVDLRKLASKGGQIRTKLPVAVLPRFHGALADMQGEVDVLLDFGRDDQGVLYIKGSVATAVNVICQRCVQAMLIEIKSDVALAMAWDEERARNLPGEYDPVIVGEEPVDVRDIIEDELLLAMPFVSYHDEKHCSGHSSYSVGDKVEEVRATEAKKENPFNVLGTLKSGK